MSSLKSQFNRVSQNEIAIQVSDESLLEEIYEKSLLEMQALGLLKIKRDDVRNVFSEVLLKELGKVQPIDRVDEEKLGVLNLGLFHKFCSFRIRKFLSAAMKFLVL